MCAIHEGKPRKPVGTRLLGRPAPRRGKILNWVLRESECMDWNNLAQDINQSWALVNTVMNIWVPKKAKNFLTSWATITFSEKILLLVRMLHIVSNSHQGLIHDWNFVPTLWFQKTNVLCYLPLTADDKSKYSSNLQYHEQLVTTRLGMKMSHCKLHARWSLILSYLTASPFTGYDNII